MENILRGVAAETSGFLGLRHQKGQGEPRGQGISSTSSLWLLLCLAWFSEPSSPGSQEFSALGAEGQGPMGQVSTEQR